MGFWQWFRDVHSKPATRAKERERYGIDAYDTWGLDDKAGRAFTIQATYEDLVQLLGKPNGLCDNFKITSQWSLRHDGGLFTIYDYKATAAYDDKEPPVSEFRKKPYAWHVGTDGSPEAARGASLVKSAMTRLRAKNRSWVLNT